MSMPVIQCKVVITRIVQYCGMHSHVSAVQGGLAEYLLEPTQRQCRKMHKTGTLVIGNNVNIANLKVNATTTRCHFAGYGEGYTGIIYGGHQGFNRKNNATLRNSMPTGRRSMFRLGIRINILECNTDKPGMRLFGIRRLIRRAGKQTEGFGRYQRARNLFANNQGNNVCFG
ncbi:hypothetical protein M0802_015621 [Mischocyttarus mexicanus]|nr:hypothetical protein M0802_015621 [Mischocyttarus mexicanus]